MIRKLWTRGFRNLSESAVSFSESGSTLVYGLNNQGKTSLLEAIYVATNGTSPIQPDLDKTICKDSLETVLGADCVVDDDFYRLYVRYQPKKKRDIILNNTPVKLVKSLHQLFHTNFISADILHIFQKDADFRRRDLDKFCSTYFKDYKGILSSYEQTLKQKNKLLKTEQTDSLLDLYNQQLISFGVQLFSYRKQALLDISQALSYYLEELSLLEFNHINCFYMIHRCDKLFNQSEYADYLELQFRQNRAKEIAIGYSCYGPHRDDFTVFMNDQSCFDFYSRGINRMIAILFQLAKIELLDNQFKQAGVLLLDDTFAEIDHVNRRLLLPFLMSKTQLIYATISDQDRDLFEEADIIQINNGDILHGST